MKRELQRINNQKQILVLKRIADRRGKVPAWSEMKKEITQGIVGRKRKFKMKKRNTVERG